MKKSRYSKKRKGAAFDRNQTPIEHRQFGVWDLYIERDPKLSYFPKSWRIGKYSGIWNDLPYLWRTIRDLRAVTWPLLLFYVVITLMRSLIPALSIWSSGQFLNILQVAVDNRAVDTHFLTKIAGIGVLCSAAEQILEFASSKAWRALNARIRQFYSTHIFHCVSRLDVPTWDDPVVAAQIADVVPNDTAIAWDSIVNLVQTGSTFVRLFSRTAVLVAVLHKQRGGFLLPLLSFAGGAVTYFTSNVSGEIHGAWAATTHNNDYIRMEGLKRLVDGSKHRKELIAGGLPAYLTAEYRNLVDRLENCASDFDSAYDDALNDRGFQLVRFFIPPLCRFLQILYTLRAVEQSSSVPVTLASLYFVQQTSGLLMNNLETLLHRTGNMSKQLSALRRLHEAGNIANQIKDGAVPFPENEQSIRNGISLEFRDVSFRYPGGEEYVLRNISFKVGCGQLCVIIGSNGSGKSTILKLVARIYDPSEGIILVNGQDIKTLRLADLRRAMAILFQDHTYFPLSIRENIALGDPTRMHNDAAIERAARLGGASEFIEKLPDGLDTYPERPVRDHFSQSRNGTASLDNWRLRRYVNTPTDQDLSGGQMQRLAVARTFMRFSSTEQGVGLLLFDEPSASLDPTAEHDLFSRLRELRGNKTMIFSTHRFGNLTRHADLILYMNDSAIVETGTHEALLRSEGSNYARLWRLQAEAFL